MTGGTCKCGTSHDGPLPVREWERCESCGHVGADCDDTCCWPDEPEDERFCQCGPGHPANGHWCYVCELPGEVPHGV